MWYHLLAVIAAFDVILSPEFVKNAINEDPVTYIVG